MYWIINVKYFNINHHCQLYGLNSRPVGLQGLKLIDLFIECPQCLLSISLYSQRAFKIWFSGIFSKCYDFTFIRFLLFYWYVVPRSSVISSLPLFFSLQLLSFTVNIQHSDSHESINMASSLWNFSYVWSMSLAMWIL
jgi:hypothetical protein